MRRREFIAGLGGAAAWPMVARAQQRERMRQIGVLINLNERDPEAQLRIATFRQALEKLGWIEGRNIRFAYRWADGDVSRVDINDFARELVALSPDLILVSTTPLLAAVQHQSRSIPILFIQVADPVGGGFVDSLARPGGNATGFTNFEFSMGGKWLTLLKEVMPSVQRVAVLFNPDTVGGGLRFLDKIKESAPTLALETPPSLFRTTAEIETIFDNLAHEPNSAMLVVPDLSTANNRQTIVALETKTRIPTMYPYRYFPAIGGLISYGIDVADVYKQVASYVDRVLKGTKPTDLPVQAPTKFELVINLTTANGLGLTIPETLLATADEVIQ